MKRIALLLFVALLTLSLRAQCPYNLTADTAHRNEAWQLNQEVSFYLPPTLGDCRSKFADAMRLWQYSAANTFNVTMSFADDEYDAIVKVHHNSYPGSVEAGSFHSYESSNHAVQGLESAHLYINAATTNCDAAVRTFSHELGHGFGLNDCNTCSNTVMRQAIGTNDTTGPMGPTGCDTNVIQSQWEPLITVEQGGWYCLITNCPYPTHLDEFACACLRFSPIVIDMGDGKSEFSGIDDPVFFDLTADGMPDRISWTGRNQPLAFLTLDRNGNGVIDDGSELFGNNTPLLDGETADNGFEALREFDETGDAMIDRNDSVWQRLQLWIDANHDGISQANELIAIADSAIERLGVTYVVNGKKDRNGNEFTYKAWLDRRDAKGRVKSDHYYDVIFRLASPRD